jgi:NAD(P)-dependent dehydrogenase (short-subunit alcohol dehydrogenase family)
MGQWLVTGANRGIGLELCRALYARGDDVIAVCRSTSDELEALGCVVIEGIDVAQPDAGTTLDRALADDVVLDVLINNAGIYLRDSLDDLGNAREQFEVNTLGPLRLTNALLPRLHEGSKIGFVSSRAGSIGDRPSGGTYGYRMSKTALNMGAANLAHEVAPRGIHVVALHPGFIRTDMTSGAGNEDPHEAAAGLIARLDELDASRSGRFFHAHGDEIPW